MAATPKPVRKAIKMVEKEHREKGMHKKGEKLKAHHIVKGVTRKGMPKTKTY